MASAPEQVQPVQARLGMWDAVSIIIGIVVGAGIYETPPAIFQSVPSPWIALGLWALAGLLALIGALCYAELASTYPRSGGDYVYLTRAYGPLLGFLFGWAQLAVVLSANIGMMAYVFADYAVQLFDFGAYSKVTYAASAVAVLTLLNALGVVLGKTAQNVLTAAKVLGLLGIVVAGFGWAQAMPSAAAAPVSDITWQGFAFAMVLLMLTYGGWNDAAFVAAELRQRRDIARSLIVGTLAITGIYLLVNAAYLWALGFDGARQSSAIATDTLRATLGERAGQAITLLVMISALGAANGLIFTGSRIYATVGGDYAILARLGRWDADRGSPVVALATQAAIALALIALVGTPAGRDAANALFERFGLTAEWEGLNGFRTLLKCTAPIFWIFFALTALSLFNLRANDRNTPRPFAVPWFPVVPFIFLLTCCYMVYSSVQYAGAFGLVGGSILLLGLPLYAVSPRRKSADVAYVPASSPEYV